MHFYSQLNGKAAPQISKGTYLRFYSLIGYVRESKLVKLSSSPSTPVCLTPVKRPGSFNRNSKHVSLQIF